MCIRDSFLNFLCLQSKRLHVLFGGSPAILIHNGHLVYRDIKRLGYNLSDLLEQLRISGYTKISAIQYAILETNGQLSVLPYASYAPLTPNDMGVEVQEDTLYTAVILDGKLYPNGLDILGYTKANIHKMMHTLGCLLYTSFARNLQQTVYHYGHQQDIQYVQQCEMLDTRLDGFKEILQIQIQLLPLSLVLFVSSKPFANQHGKIVMDVFHMPAPHLDVYKRQA